MKRRRLGHITPAERAGFAKAQQMAFRLCDKWYKDKSRNKACLDGIWALGRSVEDKVGL